MHTREYLADTGTREKRKQKYFSLKTTTNKKSDGCHVPGKKCTKKVVYQTKTYTDHGVSLKQRFKTIFRISFEYFENEAVMRLKNEK